MSMIFLTTYTSAIECTKLRLTPFLLIKCVDEMHDIITFFNKINYVIFIHNDALHPSPKCHWMHF